MRKYILSPIFLSLFSLVLLQSCNDTFEKVPLDGRHDSTTWDQNDSIGRYPELVLNGVYSNLQGIYNRVGNHFLDAASDDALPSNLDAGINRFRNGGVSAATVVEGVWGSYYQGIRRATNFIVNSPRIRLSQKNEELRSKWTSEARFLRAFYYFELVRRWGAVPILEDRLYGNDENIQVPRTAIDECFAYILSELDLAQEGLRTFNSLTGGQLGHASQEAALALKSRVKLYMASPLFAELLADSKYVKPSWEEAAIAAKELIDLNVFSLEPDFKSVFNKVEGNKEAIFMKLQKSNSSLESTNMPVGFNTRTVVGYGRTSPSQNLVDAFLTEKGTTYSWNEVIENNGNPYNNRDPRFAATFFYNGSKWLNRSIETFEGGLDKPNQNIPQTVTGYYLRKFMGDLSSTSPSNFKGTEHPHIYIRYAEILLNYAEALNEMGAPAGDVVKTIIELRKRANILAGSNGRYGLPADGELTQEKLREIIRNERRIELAFEEHRFFDIRRWKIAELVMNNPIQGVVITKDASNKLSYERKAVYNQVFDKNRMYFYPIPLNECLANKNMKQNPGWNY